MADEHRERELKFDVPEGWQLPALDGLAPAGGSIERGTVHLTSTYLDTVEHDLLRSRLTLRRRTGEADTGWHLKVPAGDARLEIRHPLGADGQDVPAELLELTLGFRGGAPLVPVATLTTERHVHRVVAAGGRPLVEVVVDDVHGTAGGEAAVITRWREVEAELADGDEQLLAEVATRLRESGARPAATASKLARALGTTPAPAARKGLAGLVAAYLDEQYGRLVGADVALRRGQDVVHGTRTASRRYRSALRVFAEIMDADRASSLDDELAWYADALGRVRDRQVLRGHLDAALGELPPELVLGPVADRIHNLLDAELAEAREALAEVLAGERYFALLRELRCWHEDPPLREDVPAGDAARFLRRARRKVRRRLIAASAQPDLRDAAMHRARKAAKRLRYTAELTEPQLGGKATKVRKRAKQVQRRLGARQDDVIAAEFLLRAGRVAGTTPGENGFTFGLLYQSERDAAARVDAQL